MINNQKTIDQIKTYCINKPGAYETRPFGEYPICYRIMGKIFAQLNPQEHFFQITLKSRPEQSELYRQLYPGLVVRGYHCPPVQQPYWNTIYLDMFTDDKALYKMIDEAYDAVEEKLTRKARRQLPEISKYSFKHTDKADKDFVYLCSKLEDSLEELVGDQFERGEYQPYNNTADISDVIIVYQDKTPVACGGFKMYDEEHAELKRIFVDPSCQGMGIGAELLRRLEAQAKIMGYRWCILETSPPLVAACHMYKKAGYKIIPNYGPYVDMEDSICMQRKI